MWAVRHVDGFRGRLVRRIDRIGSEWNRVRATRLALQEAAKHHKLRITGKETMAQAKDDRAQMTNAFSFGIPAPFINPMMTIFADLSGTLVEGLATAQRDWADFVQRRVREDVAVTRHLMNCHSIADMHQVYSQYLQTAFQHYREQSGKVVRRSESVAQHLSERTEGDTKESLRARH